MKQLFKNFTEFWLHTHELSEKQRDIIFSCLPINQQKKIQKSFSSEGWEDLFFRNKIDKIIDEIKEDFGIDIIFMRCKVLSGHSYYMKAATWEYIADMFRRFSYDNVYYALGDLKSRSVNPQTVLILSQSEKETDSSD